MDKISIKTAANNLDPWEHYARQNSPAKINRADVKLSQRANETGLHQARKYSGILGASANKRKGFVKAYKDYNKTLGTPGSKTPNIAARDARQSLRAAQKSMKRSAYMRRAGAVGAGIAAYQIGKRILSKDKKPDEEKTASDKVQDAITHGGSGALVAYFGSKGINKALKQAEKARRKYDKNAPKSKKLPVGLLTAIGATGGATYGYLKKRKPSKG